MQQYIHVVGEVQNMRGASGYRGNIVHQDRRQRHGLGLRLLTSNCHHPHLRIDNFVSLWTV